MRLTASDKVLFQIDGSPHSSLVRTILVVAGVREGCLENVGCVAIRINLVILMLPTIFLRHK